MRVLIWSEQFKPAIGGIEVLLSELLPTLLDAGYQCRVITNTFYKDSRAPHSFEGIPVDRFPFHRLLQEKNIRDVVKTISDISAIKRDWNPDIIHIHSSGPSLFFDERTLSASTAKRIHTLHGFWDEGAEKPQSGTNSLLYRSLMRADRITAVSNHLAGEIQTFLNVQDTPCEVIYNARNAPFARASACSMDPPVLFCYGRVIHDKGFDIAVRLMPEVLRRFPDAVLRIGGVGDHLAFLQDLAEQLGVSQSVEMLGFINPTDVFEYIDESSIVVVPSRGREAFGLTAVEGAMRARPVVAARLGGLPEVIQDGTTGILCNEDDLENFTQAICSLIENPERASQMGEAGRRYAERAFSWERCVSQYLALYQMLAAQSDQENTTRQQRGIDGC